MNKKDQILYCQRKIIEYAVQIARLQTMGFYVEGDSRIHLSPHDVDVYVDFFRTQAETEAKYLLGAMTMDIPDSDESLI